MLIDTHAHLQFKAFEVKVDEVVKSAKDAGVEKIIVVGTNLETSKKAITLAEKYDNLYATVGLHPHHVFSYCHPELAEGSVEITTDSSSLTTEFLYKLEQLLVSPKVLAIGETGLDRHIYQKTHYKNYQINDEFINLQKLFFKAQINLAIKHKKTLIIHNRQAVPKLLEILKQNWDPFLENRSVFHCCEPDEIILNFAKKHNVYIGIDGDITYDNEKQNFLKKIPLELLVLETDSPYFTPEPFRHSREGGNPNSNEPKNLTIIANFIAKFLRINPEKLIEQTQNNSLKLFNLPEI